MLAAEPSSDYPYACPSTPATIPPSPEAGL